jgi:glycerol uptake facilitator-like aquaporin
MTRPALAEAAAEAVGSALLLAAVIGSGIMGERLSGGNVAVALLANALATGGALYALIVLFGPISGAHFNPLVTIALAFGGMVGRERIAPYIAAQVVGAIAGAWLAHFMFGLPVLELSTKLRDGAGLWMGEVTATFGLLLLVVVGARRAEPALPAAVACYIVGAYWFTSSTSFANPAVTVARALSDTFAGIAPASAPAFIVAQAIGAAMAVGVARLWSARES